MFQNQPNTVAMPRASTYPSEAMAENEFTLLDLPAEEEASFDLVRYWVLLKKYKWLILAVLVIVVTITTAASLRKPRIFRATTLIQINRSLPKVVSFEDLAQSSYYYGSEFYETQYRLLKSRNFATKVIDYLHLDQLPAFNPQHNEKSSPLASQNPELMAEIAQTFLQKFTIEPIQNTTLVNIHYDLTNPALAAKIANGIADVYIKMTQDRRADAASFAKVLLEQRLKKVKAKLEVAEGELFAFERRKGVITLSGQVDITTAEFTATNDALMEAIDLRIAAQSLYNQSIKSSGRGVTRILESQILEILIAEKSKLEAQYQDQLTFFKPKYPSMIQLKNQINVIEANITSETTSIQKAIRNDYEAAKDRESTLKMKLKGLEEAARRLRESGGESNILSREIETNQAIYDGLLEQLKKLSVVEGEDLEMTNISIIDRAIPPVAHFKPDTRKDILMGVLFGLIAGIGLALLLELLDTTITSPEELGSLTNLPVLGILPINEKRGWRKLQSEAATLSWDDPLGTFSESVRSLRTALLFSTPNGAPKTLLVTGADVACGKSTITINLATAFAQLGGRVLVIDCDLRHPSVHVKLKHQPVNGLSNYLTGDMSAAEVTQYSEVGNFFFIPAGHQPPNPAELLGSDRMVQLLSLAGEKFDQIIIDGPPTLGLADAIILASIVDGTVLVAEAGKSNKKALINAQKRLHSVGVPLLGTIINKLKKQHAQDNYYNNYYYRAYGSPLSEQNIPISEIRSPADEPTANG